MASSKEIFVQLGEFDPSRVVIDHPEEWGTTFKVVTSKIWYLNENDEKCKLYIQGVPQTIFGISPVLETGHTELAPDDSNLKGYQISYNARSKETKDSPTEQETRLEKTFNDLRECAIAETEKEDVLEAIPGSARGLVEGKRNGVKHVFNYAQMDDPKKKGKKIPDTSSIKRAYIKLLTRQNKNGGVTCQTKFYGPGDKLISPVKYLNREEKVYHIGTLEPNFLIEGLYWGTHGTQPVGCSIQVKLAEANFTPSVSSSGGPSKRMVPPNKSAPIEESPEETVDRSTPVESEGFAKSSVRSVLMKAGTKKQPEQDSQPQEDGEEEVFVPKVVTKTAPKVAKNTPKVNTSSNADEPLKTKKAVVAPKVSKTPRVIVKVEPDVEAEEDF